MKRWEWAALIAILLLAAAMRLGVTITEFKRDEANLSQRALDLARGRDLPLLGISSSVNVPNPPISVYLLSIPFAFDSSPALATLFVGFLNVIAVAVTWQIARRYYGAAAALVAGTLYAASPWAAVYSRKIWAQDLLPPFVVATVFTGLLGYYEDKRWARWAHWPLLALTVQIHYGAFTLIPLSVLMLALWTGRVRRRELLLALAVSALTTLPGLIGAYRADLLSLDTIRDGLNQNSDHTLTVSATALDYAWFTVAGTNIHSLAGPEQFQYYLDTVPDVYPLFTLIPLGAALAAGWLLWRTIRARRWRESPDAVLVAWLIIPILVFTWEWTEVAPHYMIPLMPAAYLLCGAGVAALRQRLQAPRVRRVVLSGITLLVVIIAGWQALAFTSLLRFLDTHETPGGFGVPLHFLLDIRNAILDQHPDDVIVISDQEQAPFDEIPAVWGVLLDPVPHVRFVDGTRTAVIPAGGALKLIAHFADEPPYRALAVAGNSAEMRSFSTRDCDCMCCAEHYYSLLPVIPDASIVDAVEIAPVRFANGATLTGYGVSETNVMLVWKLSGPIDADYQAFIHALDANGKRLAQADRLSWPGRYWRAGDTLILWFDLSVPPDAAALYVGMYTFDGATYHNAETVDDTGAYLGQGATIPFTGPPSE